MAVIKNGKTLLSSSDIYEEYGLSRTLLSRLEKENIIPCIEITGNNKRRLYSKDDIEDWLKSIYKGDIRLYR